MGTFFVSAWFGIIGRNLHQACRSLLRAPAFTLVAASTLAICIGANSTAFLVLDTILLQPLSFPDGERLVRVGQVQESSAEMAVAPPRLTDWNRQTSALESITGYYTEDISDTTGEYPQIARRAVVAPYFLDVFGTAPRLGRDFNDAEHTVGGPASVIVSYRYWSAQFGLAGGIDGQVVRLGNQTATVVGVMPPDFAFLDPAVDMWFPFRRDGPFAQDRRSTWFSAIGRMKPGVAVEQAQADLMTIQTQLGNQFPDTDRDISIRVTPLKEVLVGSVRDSLLLVFAAVTVLFLIACTNIASLLMARAADREAENAIRLSLGAPKGVIALRTLAEAGILGVTGAIGGVFIAIAAVQLIHVLVQGVPRLEEITVGKPMVVFAVFSAAMVTLFCGLLPTIWDISKHRLHLSSARRTQVSNRGVVYSWLLVGVQVTLAVTLLASAGLLLRSYWEMSRVDPGFDSNRILTFRVSGTFTDTMDRGRLLQRINGTLDELRTLPGVQVAASAALLPGVPSRFPLEFEFGNVAVESDAPLVAENRSVSPDYFDALRIPLISGERCTVSPGAADTDIMVNQSFVDRYLRDRSVLGRKIIGIGDNGLSGRIVGVVGNARELGIDSDVAPTVYACYSAPNPTPWFLLRTALDPLALATPVRAKMFEIEPTRSVYDVAELEQQIDLAYHQNWLRTLFLTTFAVAATLLACLGMYGTLSYVVELRRREIGLRMALGAGRHHIVAQYLTSALRVASFACCIGVVLSLLSGSAVSSMLFGIQSWDPITMLGVLAAAITSTAVAALVPALRASHSEPMMALRDT